MSPARANLSSGRGGRRDFRVGRRGVSGGVSRSSSSGMEE